MSINIKYVRHLGTESLRALDFYGQELVFLQKRLDEIAADNTGEEVVKKIDHFQDEFIIHKRAIDELKDQLIGNNHQMELQLMKTDVYLDDAVAEVHENLIQRYKTEERLFNNMRHEFNLFAAEWM